jgi:hypothetical protein
VAQERLSYHRQVTSQLFSVPRAHAVLTYPATAVNVGQVKILPCLRTGDSTATAHTRLVLLDQAWATVWGSRERSAWGGILCPPLVPNLGGAAQQKQQHKTQSSLCKSRRSPYSGPLFRSSQSRSPVGRRVLLAHSSRESAQDCPPPPRCPVLSVPPFHAPQDS